MLRNRGFPDNFHDAKRARTREPTPYYAVNNGSPTYGSKVARMNRSTNPYFMMDGAGSLYPPYTRGVNGMQSFPVVRLRGLPFDCKDRDICQFFLGLNVVDCLLVNKDGRFSGEAYVVFSSLMQAELAIRKDRQNMGRRYVEVFQCSKQDYYRAVAAQVQHMGTSEPAARPRKPYEDKDSMEYTEFLKLRGLPYSVTKSEIVDFFGDFELSEENVQIERRKDGKATGQAYVEFSSSEVARKAMCMDGMTIGSRYVELFPSTRNEASEVEPRA